MGFSLGSNLVHQTVLAAKLEDFTTAVAPPWSILHASFPSNVVLHHSSLFVRFHLSRARDGLGRTFQENNQNTLCGSGVSVVVY